MRRPLVWIMTALVLGECSIIFTKAWIAAAIGIAAICAASESIRTHRILRGVRMLFFCFCITAAGGWRGSLYLERQQAAAALEEKTELTISGVIVKRQETQTGYRYLLTRCSTYDTVQVMVPTSEPVAEVGAAVVLKGEVKLWEEAGNPGNFDARYYYESQGIFLQLTECSILAVDLQADRLRTGLERWREHWRERLHQSCGEKEKEAGVLQSIILGDKTELDETVQQLYRLNGISHILSISGLHISLVGMAVYRLLRKFLSRGKSEGPSLLCSVLFGMMTGSSVATVRALVMLGIRLTADWQGRAYDGSTALSVAVIWLLWENPGYMQASGFWLSVLSVLGILVVTPAIRSMAVLSVSAVRAVWNSVTISVGALLTTLPVQLWFFYQISVYSVLLNLIVVPCMGLVIGFGILGCIVAGVWTAAGKICILPGVWILQFYEWLCEKAVKLPGAVWYAGKPELWQMILYYAIGTIAVISISCRRRKQPGRAGKVRRSLLTVGIVSVMLNIICYRQLPDCSITMLDVGQGDSLVFQSQRQVILVDGGSSTVSNVGKYRILPYLQAQGIDVLDCVAITHLDSDHYNGILELMQMEYGVEIKQLAMSVTAVEEPAYAEITAAAAERGIPVVLLQTGDCIRAGQLQLRILYPSLKQQKLTCNNQSVILLAEYQNGVWRGLFTGDLEIEGEEILLNVQELPEVQLLKAGHHGSKSSSGEALLEQVKPDITWISAGRNNRYGHPHAETLKRLQDVGSEVFGTYDWGAVSVSVEKASVTLQLYRNQKWR